MRTSLRLLAAAAALNMTTGAGIALGQTVVVRHSPPSETIELMLNAAPVATATADAAGDTILPLDLRTNNAGRLEIDANIFIDACDKLHRVIVVERGQAIAAQQPGCERRDIAGLYSVRRNNTLVVDIGGPNPTMMLIKGSYSLEPQRVWGAPAGLVLFGGGGLTSFRDANLIFCGDTPSCGKNAGVAYTAGAAVWLKPWLGIEGSYVQPQKPTASGSGSNYNFDSELEVRVATVAGVVAIPIGPVRLFGKGGGNFHYAKATTTNTVNGASQAFELQTQGWGWVGGGGLEVWMSPWIALYAEAGFVGIKGREIGGGPGLLDDRMRYVVLGLRAHIGR
jgi:hypothetical protein